MVTNWEIHATAALKVVATAQGNWLLPCTNVITVLHSLEIFVFYLGMCIFMWIVWFLLHKNHPNLWLKTILFSSPCYRVAVWPGHRWARSYV